jgi:hypothetical protein
MSDPQLSQETTISALTTDSGIVDLLVDSGGGEETTILPLTSIFHCLFIEECANSENGKMGWLCKWCSNKFSPRHQSLVICHVLKIELGDIAICTVSIPKEYEDRNRALYVRSTEQMHLAKASITSNLPCVENQVGDIAICTVSIPKKYEDRYRALYVRSTEWMQSKKRAHADIDDALAIKQIIAIANLLEKRGVVVSGGTTHLSPATSIHSLPSVPSSVAAKGGLVASHSFISLYTRGGSKTSTLFALSSQSSISASIKNIDIRKSHNAMVEMAIADFFHCKNIPDAIVESPRFKRLVMVCCLVGEDFVVPNRKKVGGELLDINYENTYSLNKADLIKEAKVFGFAWMGNGATIHKMPLMNILALNGTTAPI